MGFGADCSFGAPCLVSSVLDVSNAAVIARNLTASAVRIAAARSGEKCDVRCSSRSRNDSHAAARAPAAFLDDAEIDPPAPTASSSAGLSERRMDVRMTVAGSSRVQQQSMTTTSSSMTSLGLSRAVRRRGRSIQRPLGKMHLIAAARFRRQLADLRHQHGVVRSLPAHGLIGSKPPCGVITWINVNRSLAPRCRL